MKTKPPIPPTYDFNCAELSIALIYALGVIWLYIEFLRRALVSLEYALGLCFGFVIFAILPWAIYFGFRNRAFQKKWLEDWDKAQKDHEYQLSIMRCPRCERSGVSEEKRQLETRTTERKVQKSEDDYEGGQEINTYDQTIEQILYEYYLKCDHCAFEFEKRPIWIDGNVLSERNKRNWKGMRIN